MARTPDPQLAAKRRGQILGAALRCFARKGFHQTTMHEIAAEATLSAGALYRYFKSKSELIIAIAEADCQEFRAPLLPENAQENAGDDFFSRLAAATEAWIARLRQNDKALVAEVIAEAARDPELAARLAGADAPMRAAIADLIRDGKTRGDIDPALNVEEAVRVVVLALDGTVLRLLVFAPETARVVIDDVNHLLRRYFAPVGAAQSRKVRLRAERAA